MTLRKFTHFFTLRWSYKWNVDTSIVFFSTGYIPNVTRNSLTAVSELVTYDVIKEKIIHHNLMTDNFPCHVVSGLSAGICSQVLEGLNCWCHFFYCDRPLSVVRRRASSVVRRASSVNFFT